MAKQKGNRMIANNKKAYHDYFIEDKYEAGISLAGTEVKSLRMGKCSIKESFIRIERDEVFIYGMHISRTKRATFSTKIRCASENCCCMTMKSANLRRRSRKKDIHSFPCRCTSREAWSKWRSVWHAVKNCTTSGRTSRRKTRDARQRET